MTSGLNHVQRVRYLYKTILRLHRGLPGELHSLGNTYVKDEFRRHKNCNPAEAACFMMEWTQYAVMLADQLGLKGPKFGSKLGIHLDNSTLEAMREDQIQQLYELLQAVKGEGEEEKT